MMQKISCFLLPVLSILIFSCNGKLNKNSKQNIAPEKENIFPVTDFLKGQLRILDSMSITPLRIVTADKKTDSSWLQREDIRKGASQFLSPVIDSANMYSWFTEKSFLDQTINSYTFSYDPKTTLPDSVKLTHWDVYMDPQSNSINRIYMVKENGDTTLQLTWVVNKWYSIRSIVQPAGKPPQIREEKMIWNFDD